MTSGAEAPIDLTFDSDEESGPPKHTVVPSGSRPQTMPVPLPGSVPRFPPQPTHPSIQIPAAQHTNGRTDTSTPQTPMYPPFPTAHNIPKDARMIIAKRAPNGIDYVPVFSDARPGGGSDNFDNQQADKRRKVFMTERTLKMLQPQDPTKRRIGPKPKFYGVKVGHVPGVYTDRKEVEQQIKGCKGALQMRFDTREEAQNFVEHGTARNWAERMRQQASERTGEPPKTGRMTKEEQAELEQASIAQLAARSPYLAEEFKAEGKLPGQSLSPAPKNNLLSKALVKNSVGSSVRQESHIGTHDIRSVAGVPGPSSGGFAISPSHVDEMVIDSEPRHPKKGLASSASYQPETSLDVLKEHEPSGEDPFDALLDDDVYLELLAQAPANDKIALLLSASSRGQTMARKAPPAPVQNRTRRIGRPPKSINRKSSAPVSSDQDSVFSDSDTPNTSVSMTRDKSTGGLPPARTVVITVEQSSERPKWTGGLSLEEAHLVIFLKEVKKYKWTEITTRFQKHFPNRSYGIIQTNYSQKINKRDRTQDPPTLILPSCYASETHINWSQAHANASRASDQPRQRKREVEIIQEKPNYYASPIPRPDLQTGLDSHQNDSSGAESTQRRRPRRAVPVKNYTWPKRNAKLGEDSFDAVDYDYDMLESTDERPLQSESPEELAPAPEKAIAVENEPASMDFDQADAALAVRMLRQDPAATVERLPYLSASQRSSLQNPPTGFDWDQSVSRDWQGALIHVDFSPTELGLVEGVVTRLVSPSRLVRSRSQRKRLQRLLHGLTEPGLLRLRSALRTKLKSRDRRSIDAFLRDAKDDRIRSTAPRVERLAAARPDKAFCSDTKLSVSSTIRQRELGRQSRRGWSSSTRHVSYQLQNAVQDSLGPVCSYTGASLDVHTVAWSVDGQCFAAGAICITDPHSMQYNRPNNLLYGDVSRSTINELGKHHVKRPKPESGPNSTHAMYASQDPKFYKTVTSVAFSPGGRYIYSGGFDQNVHVWKTKYDGSQPTHAVSLHHKAEVLLMSVSNAGILATATKKSTGNAVKVLRLNEDDPLQAPITTNFRSDKATQRPDMNILPTALHFSPRYDNLLLGGFGSQVRLDGRDTMGDICLWDVNQQQAIDIYGSGRNVLDLSFHARNRWFAVGSVAGQNTNRGTHSTIRIYDEANTGSQQKYSARIELECRALDINDVVWCPGDDFLVAAGCTSGRAYVWDVRNPDHYLRELAHGASLMPLDEYQDREITDTGVRFLTWGDNATRLYTGSSDGVVKVWNTARSEEDTFVKDLITLDSGIMSGAFSPDRSRLLLGEVDGSVNVLEVGRDDCSIKDVERMKYVPYKSDDDEDQEDKSAVADPESGFAAAQELLETGQMMTVPMGGLPIRQAVQGPAYTGPYDASVDAPFLREQALEMQLKMAETPETSCKACTAQNLRYLYNNGPRITSEGSGDSGRSKHRIPDELRLQREAGFDNLKFPPGKLPCSSCGRPARPSDQVNADGTLLPPRCERCAFSCLRCGNTPGFDMMLHPPNQRGLDPKIEVLTCALCDCAWEIGALGYELVYDGGKPTKVRNHIPGLEGYAKKVLRKRLKKEDPMGDDNASFGDEMNALTDYYFGLALDRPESPPL